MKKNGKPRPCSHPLYISEVVENVMKYLKAAELKECRKVNKLWQKEAESQMRKGTALKLKTNDLLWEHKEGDREAFLNMMAVDENGVPYELKEPPNYQDERPSSSKACQPLTGPAFHKKPLFEKIVVMNYNVLKFQTFIDVAIRIKFLTLHIHEHHQVKALKRILIICPNLEYLDMEMWTDSRLRDINNDVPDFDFLRKMKPFENQHGKMIIGPKFPKMKTLIVKIAAYYDSLELSLADFVSNLLVRVPNLEKLVFTPPTDDRNEWSPEVVNTIIEYLPDFKKLNTLGIGFRLDNQLQLISILNNNFRLTELRLNDSFDDTLDFVGKFQPFIKFLQLSVRFFRWNGQTEINDMLRDCQASGGFKNTQSFTIHLVDMLDMDTMNQHSFNVSRNEAGHLVAVLDAFRGCVTSSHYFRKTVNNLRLAQLNDYPPYEIQMLNTVTYLELSNTPANVQVIRLLAEFSVLKKLTVVPTCKEAYEKIWALMETVEELRVFVHENFLHIPDGNHSSLLEAAITGMDTKRLERFHRPWANKWRYIKFTRPLEETLCICNLKKLRKFEIRNKYCVQIALSPLTIESCFMQSKLTSLTFPYFGNKLFLDNLRKQIPSLHLDVTHYDDYDEFFW